MNFFYHTSLDGMKSHAAYSDCMAYRYVLEREWKGSECKKLGFIMLNPSTATEQENDPTIERCERRARLNGYGGLIIWNLFAYRATDPKDMKKAADPVGAENDNVIHDAVNLAVTNRIDLICGWGVHGNHQNRESQVLKIFKHRGFTPMALEITKDNHPKHPLYIGYSASPFLWNFSI